VCWVNSCRKEKRGQGLTEKRYWDERAKGDLL